MSNANSRHPRVLLLSGIDPTGGAGLALDVRVASVLGATAAAIPTCFTDQDRDGFRLARATDDSWLLRMLDASGAVSAIKLGMCASPSTIDVIADWFAARPAPRPWFVVDPVLSATAGGGPSAADAVAQRIVGRLLPLGVVITPNHAELARLASDGDPRTLCALGARAVLHKDGHGDGSIAVDRLIEREGAIGFPHSRLRRGPVHGTGCALATALTVGLAGGRDLRAATGDAIGHVTRWIADTPDSFDGRWDPIAVSATR
ncbi:MAG: hydroxymethylpyrimidine/phosphomethylpyrimidine kinase [Planctomycetota bacterium]